MDVWENRAQRGSQRGRSAERSSRGRVLGLGPGSEAARSELFPLFARAGGGAPGS